MDLLDTTKIAEGKLTLNIVSFDLNTLIKEQIEELQRMSAAHQFIFRLGELPLIKADRERIGQVLTNIIHNAIKYMPDGGDIIITSEAIQHGVQVSVKDNGIGIPENMIRNVFNRFTRTNNPQVQSFPGMGLGLYISSGIIERHGGSISVVSKENEGSEFRFTIPVNKG
jgi:signal transduction histidine kinase